MNGPVSTVVLLVCILLSLTVLISSSSGNGHGSGGNSAHIVVPHSTSYKPALTDIQRECELEAINIGTRLADRYNSFDEETDWDVRIHHDYLTKYLGFAGWIQMGLWKNTQLTASRHHAPTIHKSGGWAGHKNITLSAYWPFDNKWVYMMGDSTQRQIWATFVSPFQSKHLVDFHFLLLVSITN